MYFYINCITQMVETSTRDRVVIMCGIIILTVLSLAICFSGNNSEAAAIKIPDGFKLGVATAAYQIEGGWNASGKGENIWDHFTHGHPEAISDHSNGDVTCDSYHLWKKDLDVLLDLKVDHYRFSLSWSRILPTGYDNQINKDGVRYYNMIIDDLLTHNIEPMVTLYHWDLPQPLQQEGGWTNIETAIYFANYARIAFHLFGNRVKKWITINEPYSICEYTYGNHDGAPYILSPGIGDYLCGRTVILAHAKAYRVYASEFAKVQNGKVGITIDSIWAEPISNSSVDIAAAEREMQMGFGWFTHQIFSAEGDYPTVMRTRIDEMSRKEGYHDTRLPELSREDIKLIKGSFDFLGLNHYRTLLIQDHEYPISSPSSFVKDKGTNATVDPQWKPSPSIVPWGLRKLLNWIKKEYDNPLVYITENGFADDQPMNDTNRLVYLQGYMLAMMQAVLEDGCNVQAYTVWCSMDNWEWTQGFTKKFGLYHVDFSDPDRPRTPKLSAGFYRNVTTTRVIPTEPFIIM